MAGENLARLMRDRARGLALKFSRERHRDGDPEGAAAFRDLAAEISAIPVSGE